VNTQVTIENVPSLDPHEIEAIALLVEQVTEADGVRPLDEHVTLHIREGGDVGARHLLAWKADDGTNTPPGDQLVGYAHLDLTDAVEGPVAELVVHPTYRRDGIGGQIVNELLSAVSGRRLRLWAHGENAASARLAESLGFSRTRVLWQMRRSLSAALPRLTLPHDVRIRAFIPGRDDQAWIDVNSRAFANHPEQGRWTLDDLHLRMVEPWFDPDGFLLAVTGDGDDERVVGFHWTKVHGGDSQGHYHDRLGEVYVVGVDPDYQRSGLGRVLTIAGLVHLRSRGLSQAMLYVDAVNTNAIRVYESIGFSRWDTDVMFMREK